MDPNYRRVGETLPPVQISLKKLTPDTLKKLAARLRPAVYDRECGLMRVQDDKGYWITVPAEETASSEEA